MSIRNAGQIIKETRISSGFTQEYLSDGICTLVALNKIENGKLGVSPSTFQLLMAKAGSKCEALPTFKNREDFTCYVSLKEIKKYINSWNLFAAYEELLSVRDLQYCNNRNYYQEFLLLYSWVQYRSYSCDLKHIKEVCVLALQTTLPNILTAPIKRQHFSNCELELGLILSNVLVEMKEQDKALEICNLIEKYQKSLPASDSIHVRLRIELFLTFSKIYFEMADYEKSLSYVLEAKNLSFNEDIDIFRYEIYLLEQFNLIKQTGLTNNQKNLEYVMHMLNSLSCPLFDYALHKLHNMNYELSIPGDQTKKAITFEKLSFSSDIVLQDGDFDIYNKDVVNISTIICSLRKEQKKSQKVICQGLCSVSKLSKIENGTLVPDVLLAEALLNRLGVSERLFTFYGNKYEAQFNELKYRLLGTHKIQNNGSDALQEMYDLYVETDNHLIKQHYLFFKALHCPSAEDQLTMLHEALELTLPNFDINNILEYRFTWIEASILNGIAFYQTGSRSVLESNNYFQKLNLYINTAPITPGLMNTVFNRTLCLYYRFLFENDMNMNIVLYTEGDKEITQKNNLSCLSDLFYFTALSYGKLNDMDKLKYYATLTIALELINNCESSAQNLKDVIYQDYHIEL